MNIDVPLEQLRKMVENAIPEKYLFGFIVQTENTRDVLISQINKVLSAYLGSGRATRIRIVCVIRKRTENSICKFMEVIRFCKRSLVEVD